jgi:hypothetical protein
MLSNLHSSSSSSNSSKMTRMAITIRVLHSVKMGRILTIQDGRCCEKYNSGSFLALI